ncbi:MAG: MFS transporter [Nitrospinota bacterium]
MGLGHGVNDSYLGLLAPLLPAIIAEFGLSITLASALAAVLGVTSSLIQPLFGPLADRFERRKLAGGAVCVTALGLGSMGLAPSYGALLILLIIGSIGVAAFHPAGAAVASLATQGPRRAVVLSLFNAGGTFGYTAGPLAVAFLVSRHGLGITWVSILPGLLMGYLLWRLIPPSGAEAKQRRGGWREIPWRRFPPIIVAATLRSLAYRSFTYLIPLVLVLRGERLEVGALAVAAFGVGAALGGILGSELSVRWGKMAIIYGALALSPLPLAGVLLASATWAVVLLMALSGLAVGSCWPVMMLAAQEAAPAQIGTASSLTIGLSWGSAGLLFVAVGWLADLVGPARALWVAVAAPWLALAVAARIPPALAR